MIKIDTATHAELCDVINNDFDLSDWWIKKDFGIPEEMDLHDVRNALQMWVEEGDECFIL